MNRTFLLVALATVAAACGKADTKAAVIPTATIQRRDIIVTAEATGIIEPINIIEVKSKTASGQVMKMPVEIGTYVRPGDLIVQIDTTNITIQYKQAAADLAASKSNFDVAQAALKRQEQLFAERIITRPDLESAQTAFANANASLQRNQQNLDLAKQALIDAKVVATTEGTVITKPVSLGQVIQAGGTSVNGGTVIVTMADLTKVRSRALVNETDIGMVQAGQQSQVTVDAFPDRPFRGTVEKIEPQATVQQNVTMFPVLVSLDNSDGLLKPGMNGEVQVLTDERLGAIAVPNDAIRSTREARQAAALLGLNPDSVQAQLRAAMGGGNGRGGQGGAGGSTQAGPGGPGGPGGATQQSRGELDFAFQGGGDPQQRGGFGGRGGFNMPQVTDADCKKVDDAMKQKPAAAKKLEEISAKMRDPNADRQAVRAESEAVYKELGLDPQVARACRFRNGGGRGGMGGQTAPAGAQGAMAARGGATQGASRGGAGMSNFPASKNSTQGGGMGAGGMGGGGRQRTRTGLVFVQKGTTWEPRVIRLGVANYDYTEVLDGLVEGDKVAMMSAAALQAKRQEMQDRMKSMTGSPLGGPGGGRGGRGG
ncbi:MAG: efflux RND transporter periplasmic adaptor subunit [Gemmatimonadetes bacterium]|nr:efflux RND transporter periplasmic adaptor subunit [Gemmatimonadota bacterium]MBI3569162.1 efflux RND transporter periplasmic adaptor subunit [Gemmatimonadota bacterium]